VLDHRGTIHNIEETVIEQQLPDLRDDDRNKTELLLSLFHHIGVNIGNVNILRVGTGVVAHRCYGRSVLRADD
jgi:hypothetical protein